MRMFAGPNGSGKSTLLQYLPPGLLGTYVNPDDLESALRSDRRFSPADYGLAIAPERLIAFLDSAPILGKAGEPPKPGSMQFNDGAVLFESGSINPYLAAALADLLRQELLASRQSFSFETVMSSSDKVQLLANAKAAGYRTYLYFIATEDPIINVARVRNRVRLRGHPVAEEKIEPRYHRSLGLLREAIKHTDRAYMFDNSGDGTAPTWFAEITDGENLKVKSDRMPAWFQRVVLDKVSGDH